MRKSNSTRLLLTWVVLALLFPVLLSAQGRRRAAGSPVVEPPTAKSFAADQLEAYLTDDGIAYVRPGLKIKVNSVTIGADRKPVVDLTITDDFDQPLDRLGKTTPGAISISMILAWYDGTTREYTAYTTRVQTSPATSPNPGVAATQASADSGGTFVDLEQGHARYTFRTALPANFDASKTHTLGIYSTRNLTDIVGKNYYANVLYDFRPDGAAITEKWDKITTASCNNCHDPLAAHGGSRRELKLCVLCHSNQTVDPDTGESQDMEILAHKIHMGANLPSVQAGKPYIIIGNGQSVHDYSHVVFPQDIRNCQNCHEGRTAAQKASQSELWQTAPTRDACGACHDDINWVTGHGHVAGPQLNDNACSSCHQPESGHEFDASVAGAHTIPEKSSQLAGLNASIVSVTNTAPGQKPVITFKVTNKDGSFVDASKLATFAPIMAGPTTDYTKYWRDNAVNKGVFDAATGTTTYTFANAIPETATGTWGFSADVYRNSTIQRNDGEAAITLREAAFNPIFYAAVTDAAPQPRRTTVTTAQCNNCHDRLALHGGQRQNVQECVMCHNPVESDVSRRPASAGAPESISMQRMIHRIHAGSTLTQDFTVYGFGNTAHNYNHVTYVGDLRNCTKCHTNDGFNLPLPSGTQPVITLRDYFSPQGPGTAACLGCHDNPDAAAHAYLNTTQFPGSTQPAESCATCHGTGSEWDVAKVHAR